MPDDDLEAAYRADSPQATEQLYDRWASDYEADMGRLGYRHPAVAVALFSRHVPTTTGPVLDAGAGTGMVGELLSLVGYRDVEALDLSEAMLAVAASKGVYRSLHRASLDDALPFEDGAFAAAIAVGVFTTGHVSTGRVGEVVRVVRPGGVLVATVKDDLADASGPGTITDLVARGVVTRADRTPSYHSMPGHSSSSRSHAVVLRRSP
jgi:predicted TPR repeat methyltransferase